MTSARSDLWTEVLVTDINRSATGVSKKYNFLAIEEVLVFQAEILYQPIVTSL